MNKRDAKREVLGMIAADVRIGVSCNSWEEQGLLDDYDEKDHPKLYAAALEVADELSRRAVR